MAREYVLIPSLQARLGWHIVAEVVVDDGRGDDGRDGSIAATIAGSVAMILDGNELAQTAYGRDALRRWEARDDRAFDFENRVLEATGGVPIAAARSSSGPIDPLQLDQMAARTRVAARNTMGHMSTVIADNRRLRNELRAHREELRSRRARLAAEGPAAPAGPRLRIVQGG